MILSERLHQRIDLNTPALPALNLLNAAVHRIQTRWPDVVAEPPEKDREKLVSEMRDRVAQDRWDGAKLSFVTRAARALFETDRRDRADLAALRIFYYDEVRASSRTTFLRAMLAIHIGSYEPGAPHTRALGAALRAVKDRLGSRGSELLRHLPELLDPVHAPDAVARLMVNMDDPWTELKSVGLRSPHAPGLMQHAHLAYVKLIKSSLRDRSGLERLFAWIKPSGREPLKSGAAEVIAAVLGHWRKMEPTPDDLTYITQSLIGLYGDPRVHSGGAWTGVAPDILAIILRWLTGENIRFFLDVVSAVEDSHMWEPRRRFWLKLHEHGRIDGAWVAFSSSGAAYARRSMSTSSASGLLRFGQQIAGGGRSNTSLLVLKIGRKIVIEGSHNYKIHIFDEKNHNAPQLYRREYDCELDQNNCWITLETSSRQLAAVGSRKHLKWLRVSTSRSRLIV